jgi:hypothetical protein
MRVQKGPSSEREYYGRLGVEFDVEDSGGGRAPETSPGSVDLSGSQVPRMTGRSQVAVKTSSHPNFTRRTQRSRGRAQVVAQSQTLREIEEGRR